MEDTIERGIRLEDVARAYPHLTMIAMMGKTADHLREKHGVEPTDGWQAVGRLNDPQPPEVHEARLKNLKAHLAAHRADGTHP
jgi:hypothetical protein